MNRTGINTAAAARVAAAAALMLALATGTCARRTADAPAADATPPSPASAALAGIPAVAELAPPTPQKIRKTIQGITFDSDYDNGSLLDVESADGGAFFVKTWTEPGEKWAANFWFRFRITGARGRRLTLRFDRLHTERPAVRWSGGAWRRATAAEAPGSNTLVLEVPPETEWAEVAFYFPLGVEETYREVRRIVAAAGPDAALQEIGRSRMGRPLLMATVTDRSVPDAGKHRVWVHARTHPGEVTAAHTLLGFLEQVAEDSPLGARLRSRCIFNIVPVVNVDGVWLGLTRWNPWGRDLEDRWCEAEEPETQALKARIDAFMAGPNPIEVALNLHSSQAVRKSDSFFWKHVRPSVTERFERIQQRFIDAFDRATPLFDNRSPGESQLEPCRFVESYFWNNWGERVMAITYEGHFRRRLTDGEFITAGDHRALGRALATALIQYFDLPE
ncbi:MAG: M14-type cytosolic carboxypeptidase [Candidatus Sumerlaeia bacterium]